MKNRREFLQTSVLASALPLAVSPLLPARGAFAGAESGSRLFLHKAIFDDRYAQGRAFAGAMQAFGARVYALQNGDVTSLWYGELDLLWRREMLTRSYRPVWVAARTARGGWCSRFPVGGLAGGPGRS